MPRSPGTALDVLRMLYDEGAWTGPNYADGNIHYEIVLRDGILEELLDLAGIGWLPNEHALARLERALDEDDPKPEPTSRNRE